MGYDDRIHVEHNKHWYVVEAYYSSDPEVGIICPKCGAFDNTVLLIDSESVQDIIDAETMISVDRDSDLGQELIKMAIKLKEKEWIDDYSERGCIQCSPPG
jgi:hypothetical protein